MYAYKIGFFNGREFVLLYDGNRSKKPRFSVFELWKIWTRQVDKCWMQRWIFTSIKMTYTNLRMHFSYQMSWWRTMVCNCWIYSCFVYLHLSIPAFSYPCWYRDMVFHFARPVPEIWIWLTEFTIDGITCWLPTCVIITCFRQQTVRNMLMLGISQAQLQTIVGVSLMELFGQFVGQVSIKELSTMDTSGCIS